MLHATFASGGGPRHWPHDVMLNGRNILEPAGGGEPETYAISSRSREVVAQRVSIVVLPCVVLCYTHPRVFVRPMWSGAGLRSSRGVRDLRPAGAWFAYPVHDSLLPWAAFLGRSRCIMSPKRFSERFIDTTRCSIWCRSAAALSTLERRPRWLAFSMDFVDIMPNQPPVGDMPQPPPGSRGDAMPTSAVRPPEHHVAIRDDLIATGWLNGRCPPYISLPGSNLITRITGFRPRETRGFSAIGHLRRPSVAKI